MKYRGALLLTLAMVLAGSAGAQTIQGLSQELNVNQTKLASLNKIMAESARTDASLNKEYKGYVADQKRKTASYQRALAEQIRKVKVPLEAKMKAIAENYNSHCGASHVGKLRRPQYDNCVRWKARAQREIDRMKQRWTAHAKEWNAKHAKPINDTIAKLRARMKQIDALMKANFKRNSDAQDGFIAATKRIKQTVASLKTLCDPHTPSTPDKPFTEDERRKWCSNIGFDDVIRKLPPMYHD